VPVGVDLERAGPRVADAAGRVDGEVAVAVERDVERVAGGGDRAGLEIDRRGSARRPARRRASGLATQRLGGT
jgi:hypothetical protein